MRGNNSTENTCRLCLAKVDEKEFIPIFPQKYLNGVSLVMKIMVCVSLTIQEDDLFPKRICTACEESVNTFYAFRETCSQAYFMLIQNYGNAKDLVKESESKLKDDSECSETVEKSLSEENERNLCGGELTGGQQVLLRNDLESQPNPKEKCYFGDQCLEKLPDIENVTKHENSNNDFDLERNIPEHHIMCLDTDQRSVDEIILEGGTNSEIVEKTCNNDIEGSAKEICFKDKSLLIDNATKDETPVEKFTGRETDEDLQTFKESSSTLNEISSTNVNVDADCYQVEEIHQEIRCGKYIEQQIRYKCLRCKNSFSDLDSVTAHYADYCQPNDCQEIEQTSAESNDAEGSTNYLNAFAYLDENFELENEDMPTLESLNNCSVIKDSQCSESKKINGLDGANDEQISIPGREKSIALASSDVCVVKVKEKFREWTSETQLINSDRERKRRGRCPRKVDHPCSECDRIFASSSLLKRHSSVHSGERPYACEICDRRFAQLGQLNFHKKFHSNPRYRCYICSKPFLRPSDIEKHMRTHTGEKPFDCKICLKSFAQLGALQQHSRIHSGEKPYSCEICGKNFSQKANKTKHVKIHKEGERPHTCDICGRSFSELSEMELHRAGHGGGKPRKCDHCEDSFRKLSELNDHVRRFHTFERQHKCMFCSKEFYSIYNLKQHVMVHTGQKPFACSKCDLRFTQKGNLTKHYERKHSKFVEKGDCHIVVNEKSFDGDNLLFAEASVNQVNTIDRLIVEREETIEMNAQAVLRKDFS
ncbi:zinc finger protein 271-like [Neodiprion fabricii]|uniref:zinc finger protein 271-like n=1 Tax=Neodiprion fabricii TaxID=2872261 RepID=UPI001ED93131|nr:zinc finger protein 271-like [Neodiprion fabricii]